MTLTQINKAGLDEIALDHVFTIGASGTDHYTFQGEGLNGTVNDPTLYLTRGKTYRFENGSGGHPIRIQSTSGASGTAYNTGVTNNAGSGTVIVEVQHDAPDVLYYQCTSHAAMNGILYITGALADGGVTTAKLADDAVTNAKITDDAVGSGQIATGAVTLSKIGLGAVNDDRLANDAVTTAKIADGAVTADKIASQTITANKIAADAVGASELADSSVAPANLQTNSVTTAKIANEAVTLAKLPHGTSSNNGKFLRANNGADPTFETVSSDFVKISSTTMSGEASEFDLTFDNSTYSQFKLYICGLNFSYDANLYIRFRVGTSFITASNYYGGTIKKYAGGFDSNTYGGQHQSYGYLTDNVGGNDGTYERWSGIIDILCGNSGGMPFLRHDSFYKDASSNHANTMGIVGYQNWSIISGIRVYASSGNINHGKFELYGVK